MMPLTSHRGCGERGRRGPASTVEGEDEGMLSFLELWKAQGLSKGPAEDHFPQMTLPGESPAATCLPIRQARSGPECTAATKFRGAPLPHSRHTPGLRGPALPSPVQDPPFLELRRAGMPLPAPSPAPCTGRRSFAGRATPAAARRAGHIP